MLKWRMIYLFLKRSQRMFDLGDLTANAVGSKIRRQALMKAKLLCPPE